MPDNCTTRHMANDRRTSAERQTTRNYSSRWQMTAGLPVKTPPTKTASRQHGSGKVEMAPSLLTDDTNSFNYSVFSYLRTLATWHCPHSPAAAASPARRAHSSKPATAHVLLLAHAETDKRTDRRTDTVPFHRHCSAQYTCSAIHRVTVT